MSKMHHNVRCLRKYRRNALTAVIIVALAYGAAFPVLGSASEIMPDFASIPTGWVTDRYQPNSFANVGTFQGRNNVLAIGITSAEGLRLRPSGYQTSFYNTQGMQYALAGGAGSTISADLWIPASWRDSTLGNARTDMWGVMTDGTGVAGYPIIGFTNYGGTARYRAWEDDVGVWVDLGTPVAYDAWTAFAIAFTGSAYEYYINGNLVYTDYSIGGSTGFSATIMQAYNFYGDLSLTGAVPMDYTANWSNAQVPEPASLLLLGFSLIGLAGVAIRRKR